MSEKKEGKHTFNIEKDTGWNDYSICIRYKLYVDREYVGDFRLVEKDTENKDKVYDKTYIPEKIKKYNQREVSIEELKEDFNKRENGIYTLGVDINYYKRLNEILSDNIDLDNFLKYMGDLTFKDNDLTDSERKDVVIKDALLRDEKFDDESIGHSGDLYNVSCLYKQLNSNSGNFLILFKDRYDEVLLNLLNASEKVREELNKFKENLYFYEILNHICDYFIKYGKQENSTFTTILIFFQTY